MPLMPIEARPGETVDDLQRGGLRILQPATGFRFGMDAVLLADFAAERFARRAADLGTGTGVIPLMMSARMPAARFDAVEIQPDMADMAARSVRLNGLLERISVREADLRALFGVLPRAAYDTVTCNPPYGKEGAALKSPNSAIQQARQEETCTLADVAQAAAYLLRTGGRLCMTCPAPRLLEAMDALRQRHIEPKRLRLVQGHAQKPPYLALLEGVLGAKAALHILPTLVVYGEDGQETACVKRIYGNG